MDRYNHTSQAECLTQRKERKQNEKRPKCFLTYSPLGNEIKSVLQEHWHIINSDPSLNSAFTGPPQTIFKRAPNLRSILVRSEHKPSGPRTFLDNKPAGNFKCNACAQCNATSKSDFFIHPHTKKKIKVKGTISCSSTNCIYMLMCPCNLAYVGQTSRALKTRISEHRSNIRCKNPKSPVAVHFNNAGHSVSSLRYTGIEQVKLPSRGGNIHTLLSQRETYWIYTLNTRQPAGLNEDYDIDAFL